MYDSIGFKFTRLNSDYLAFISKQISYFLNLMRGTELTFFNFCSSLQGALDFSLPNFKCQCNKHCKDLDDSTIRHKTRRYYLKLLKMYQRTNIVKHLSFWKIWDTSVLSNTRSHRTNHPLSLHAYFFLF